MSKNLGIQEAFRWRETRGQRLTVPPLYWSPLPGLLSCLLSVITVISSPLLSWQGLTVLPQPDITRKEMFSSLEDCAAKCYLLLQSTVQGSCGHSLVWRTFFFAFDWISMLFNYWYALVYMCYYAIFKSVVSHLFLFSPSNFIWITHLTNKPS